MDGGGGECNDVSRRSIGPAGFRHGWMETYVGQSCQRSQQAAHLLGLEGRLHRQHLVPALFLVILGGLVWWATHDAADGRTDGRTSPIPPPPHTHTFIIRPTNKPTSTPTYVHPLHTWRCTPTMCLAMAWSVAGLHSSRTTKKRSKRDMMGGEMATFALRVLLRSYLSSVG